jgi:hypothetical protein
MANDLIRIRRDTFANWQAADPVLALGEISYDLTNHEIRVGDGSTAWLSLPTVGNATLADGDKGDIVVASSGTSWTLDAAIVADIASKLEASALNLGTATTPATTPLQIRRGATVDWVGVILQNGEIGFDYQFNEIRIGDGTNTWENLDPVGSNKIQNMQLQQLGDVEYGDLMTDDVLTWNGTTWINQAIPPVSLGLDDLTGVTLTSPTLGQILQFNGTVWVNAAAPSGGSGVTLGVKNDITVVGENDWQITANSIETAMLQASSVNAAKLGGVGITTYGKALLKMIDPASDQQIPLWSTDAGLWVSTTASDLVGPIALNSVLQLKDNTNGLLGISNQGLVDQSFLGANYVGTSRQVLGTNSWLPENLYQNNTLDSVLYSDGKSLGTWSLSSLTTGSVLFDLTAIITAQADLADATAAIKTASAMSLKDVSLEFTARVKVRGAAPTANTSYLIGFYDLTPSSKKYAAIKAGATNWESVIKPDGAAAGTTTASSTSVLTWTDVKITILNNEIKTYVNNTLLSTSSVESFTSLNLGCVVYADSAAFPQPELEVEYMRLNATTSSGIHPRLIQQAGATTGQALAWSGTSWTPQTISSGGGGATNLDGLSDVTLTDVSQSNFLWYDAGTWRNVYLTLDKAIDVATLTPSNKQPFVYDAGDQQWKNSSDILLNTLEFNIPPTEIPTAVVGKIYWDTTSSSIVTPLSGNALSSIGLTNHVRVWNNDNAVDIPKGRAVRVTGGHGSTDITVALANASSESTAATTLGFTSELIPANGSGYVITSGLLTGINTNLVVNGVNPLEGMGLWLDTVSGEVTVDRPVAPNHGVFMGWLIKKAGGTAGQILVKVINGSELDELHNVLITTPLTGHVLRYNGTVWANAALAVSDVTGLQTALDGKAATTHSHAIGDVTGLQGALDGKAATTHSHAIGDVTGLQGALDGKAATTHSHAIGDVTGLQTALDGKAATTHSHAIGDVTGLQTALDGKAATTHSHAIGDVTGLQGALDGKAATTHTHAAGDITSGTIATARLGSGTADNTTFLRGDNTWATVSGGGGATNLDGLSDVILNDVDQANFLWYDAGTWRNVYLTLNKAVDVGELTPTTGDILWYNGGEWVDATLQLNKILELQSPVNGQIVGVTSGEWTVTTLNTIASLSKLDPIGITPSTTAGRFLVTSLFNASGEPVSDVVHGNFIDTATIDATFEDRSVGTPAAVAKWKFDVKDSSLGTVKLGGDITAAGKALLDDATTAAQRATLELGTAATANTGDFAAASHTHAAGDITSGTIATARLGSGTADNTTFLRGDNTWATVSGGATNLDGLSDVVITTPASYNLLGYNGTNWVNRAVNDAINDLSLGVGKLAQGTATANQVLAWNNLTGWTPADPPSGSAPGGNTGEFQYNDGGTLAGAANVEISSGGNIKLVNSSETAGVSGSVILMSKNIANRPMISVITGNECPITNLQLCIARNRIAMVSYSGSATTLHQIGIVLTASGTGTGSGTVTFTNALTRIPRIQYASSAAVDSYAGVRTGSQQLFRGNTANSGGGTVVYRFGRTDSVTTTPTEYHGLTSTTTIGAAQRNPEAASSYNDKFGIGLRAGDTNYQVLHCTGTAAATVVDTGIAAVANAPYRIELFWAPNSSEMGWLLVREDTGASANGTVNTALPTVNTALGFMSHRSTASSGVTAVNLNFISYYQENIGTG